MARIKVKCKKRDPESKAKLLSLFEQGKGIHDPEVKALGYKNSTPIASFHAGRQRKESRLFCQRNLS